MGLPQSVITRQMVLAELIKVGIKQEIADDLSYRYYKNELTHKDIEYLKENFDIKLEKVEASLKAEITSVRNELKSDIEKVQDNLNNKIDNVRNELKSDIEKVQDNLNNKIDNVRNELKSDIEKVEVSLRAEIKASHSDLDNKIDNVENNLNNKIDNVRNELKSDIASVSNEVALVRKDMEMNKIEINSQLVNITSELKSSSKLHFWMFGTVITLFVGMLLTLIFK